MCLLADIECNVQMNTANTRLADCLQCQRRISSELPAHRLIDKLNQFDARNVREAKWDI